MKDLQFGRDRWSDVALYKVDGVVEAKAYHLTCEVCGIQYYYSYKEKSLEARSNTRTFFSDLGSQQYLLTSRNTAFQVRYLNEVAVDMELGRSFEDVTERYNRLYGSSEIRGQLNKTRLEDAYFLFKLKEFFKHDITVDIDMSSNRVNIDRLCDEAVKEVFTSDNKWKQHKCNVIGCSEGFVMCDGNEKLSRRICAAPRESFKLASNMPRIVAKCGNSPVFGGQHQKASKFCKDHSHNDQDEPAAKKIIMTLRIPDQIVSTRIVNISSTLPSNAETSMHTACKSVENVRRYHDKTAGVMAVVRPCGIILDCREMYTCESSSQLFVQLLKLIDEPGINIKYIGYDRACEFKPFLRNLKGNVGAAKLLEAEYLVDNFHISGHKKPECDLESPKCEYHHSLPKFAAIANANTECAEQTFSWLKRYKSIVKYMTAPRFRFFLYVVIQAHNKAVERKAKH